MGSLEPSNKRDFDLLMESIKKGMKGENQGLPMGFPRLSNLICGIQKSRYDLIFSREGVGKTSFVDLAYCLNPYEFLKKNESNYKLKVIYWSLEITKEAKLAKWMALKLWFDYGFIVDANEVLSKGKNRCSQELFDKIYKTKDYFYELEDTVTIIDREINATGVYKFMRNDYGLQHGKFIQEKISENLTKEVYVENDPNLITVVVVDTVGNLKCESVEGSYTKKINIEKLSSYAKHEFRNKCKFSPVLISHANRSIGATDRSKYGEIFHQLEDVKETNSLGEDCNTAICLFNPNTYMNENNKVANMDGYKFDQLRERGRVLGVLKNREGEANARIGLNFMGETGGFRELPPVKDMTSKHYTQSLNFEEYD